MTTALTYEYSGRDVSGKTVKGRMDASTETAVVSRLRTMGIAPLAIKEIGTGTGLNRDLNFTLFTKHAGLKDLAIMSRQMATMIAAGLSLLQTLTILADQTDNKELAGALLTVRKEVETGVGFSEALQHHPTVFPPLMINLVKAGETGGFLETSLESIATNYEKEAKLRNTIKAALTYPVIVLVISLLSVVGMLIFIVPVFEKMFNQLGGQLPVPTQILVWLSHVMVWLGPLLIVAIIAFSVWWRRNKHLERVRKVSDPIKLRLPVFGKLLAKIAIARFTRNFSTMIGAGVPILRSLSIVGETSGNYVLEQALVRVQESVRIGKSIAAPLALQPIFPPMVTQMIAVGEDAGALEHMLSKIADFYDDEVQSTTEQLTALIEPLMIAFLGIIIGGMVVALYLPLFGIIQQVQHS